MLKRLLVLAGAFNLGLWMRTRFGVGTPRSLQGRVVALGAMLAAVWMLIADAFTVIESPHRDHHTIGASLIQISRRCVGSMKITICTTGC